MRNQGFIEKLRTEMLERAKRNPNYSLRAYARYLEIEASSLSQILSGKRPLTDTMCHRLGKRLNLSESEVQDLITGTSTATANSYKTIEKDLFEVISDWFHFAILELTHLPHFKPSEDWISQTLGISQLESKAAIQRLFRLQMLVEKDGRWVDNLGDAGNEGNRVPSEAYARYQRQILMKSLEAMDNTPYEERVQTSSTFTMSNSDILKLKRVMLKCVHQIKKAAQETKAHDEVYQLSLSLFPVSKTKATNQFQLIKIDHPSDNKWND
ncbi:MAG: hypothetical protein CL675_07205 [Bdellovibrionaceae bacterium]|nr:hypothetical protein [Pseudobdellovibrionaceae bacterium]